MEANRAIDEREEGLIMKKPSSQYTPGLLVDEYGNCTPIHSKSVLLDGRKGEFVAFVYSN